MSKYKFDGSIDGKRVKVIVDTKKGAYFAKPKDFNVDTPHFYKDHGVSGVHQDSEDGKSYRKMIPQLIASGTIHSGKNYVRNRGLDMTLLPMHETADGFYINTTPSGFIVTLPSGIDDQYCLMAFGEWSSWQLKV